MDQSTTQSCHVQVDTPEYVTMGGEDTAVYIYDISGQHHKGAKVVNKLQV